MSFRDDHGAALARIAALEAELEVYRGDERPAALRHAAHRVKELETKVGKYREDMRKLNDRVQSWRTQTTSMQREMAAKEARLKRARAEPGEIPTLTEFNRRRLPTELGRPAGVRCPLCAVEGESVEMVANAPLKRMLSFDASSAGFDFDGVMCPRCCFLGGKRH